MIYNAIFLGKYIFFVINKLNNKLLFWILGFFSTLMKCENIARGKTAFQSTTFFPSNVYINNSQPSYATDSDILIEKEVKSVYKLYNECFIWKKKPNNLHLIFSVYFEMCSYFSPSNFDFLVYCRSPKLLPCSSSLHFGFKSR